MNWIANFIILIFGIPVTGFLFPFQWSLSAEKRALAIRAFDLTVDDSDGDMSDGLYESYLRIRTWGKFFHDWKAVVYHWTQRNDKFAVHFLCFLSTWPWIIMILVRII